MTKENPIARLFCFMIIINCVMLSLSGLAVVHADDITQYCAYWYIDSTTDATLEIANNSDERKHFTPTLMIDGKRPFTLDPIAVDPGGTVSLALRDAISTWRKTSRTDRHGKSDRWGDGSRSESTWGSAHLRGVSFIGIHSWIVVNDRERGLSVNSMFEPARGSTSLVSMWWHPTPQTEEFFVLQNTAGKQIKVRATFILNGQILKGRSFRIQPGNAYLGSIRDLMRRSDLNHGFLDSGSVRFDIIDRERRSPGSQGTTKEKTSVGFQGITMVFDEEVGFSSPLHMHRPEKDLSNQLQLAGVLKGNGGTDLGLPDYANFAPHLKTGWAVRVD